jgi:putative endonuclease
VKYLNRQTGRVGEQAAAEYLQSKGYEVISRNFSTRFGEIDLICRVNDITVFVEVKTKKGGNFGSPEEMFTRYKYEKVRRMGQVFLGGKEVPCRIDMVAVELGMGGEVKQIRHYQNVTG